ncbi:hypothetical protein GEMRC1_004533 [Eukaryota sp. GEM-RC1]
MNSDEDFPQDELLSDEEPVVPDTKEQRAVKPSLILPCYSLPSFSSNLAIPCKCGSYFSDFDDYSASSFTCHFCRCSTNTSLPRLSWIDREFSDYLFEETVVEKPDFQLYMIFQNVEIVIDDILSFIKSFSSLASEFLKFVTLNFVQLRSEGVNVYKLGITIDNQSKVMTASSFNDLTLIEDCVSIESTLTEITEELNSKSKNSGLCVFPHKEADSLIDELLKVLKFTYLVFGDHSAEQNSCTRDPRVLSFLALNSLFSNTQTSHFSYMASSQLKIDDVSSTSQYYPELILNLQLKSETEDTQFIQISCKFFRVQIDADELRIRHVLRIFNRKLTVSPPNIDLCKLFLFNIQRISRLQSTIDKLPHLIGLLKQLRPFVPLNKVLSDPNILSGFKFLYFSWLGFKNRSTFSVPELIVERGSHFESVFPMVSNLKKHSGFAALDFGHYLAVHSTLKFFHLDDVKHSLAFEPLYVEILTAEELEKSLIVDSDFAVTPDDLVVASEPSNHVQEFVSLFYSD